MSKKRKGQNALKTLKQMWEKSNTEEKIMQAIREQFSDEIYFKCLQGEFFYFGGIWYLLLPEYLLLPLLKRLNNSTGTIHIKQEIVKLWNTDTDSIIRIHNLKKHLQEGHLK